MARSAVTVVDLDLGFDAIMKDVQDMVKKTVLIGIQEGSRTHVQSKNGRRQKAGISIAEYAAQNEFGTDKIPERSFMRSSFDENLNLIEMFVLKEFGYVVDQKQTSQRAFNRIGEILQGMVQTKIRKIMFPPNSRKTIALKKSSKPLIDFGQMIAAVRYVVKNNRRNKPSM